MIAAKLQQPTETPLFYLSGFTTGYLLNNIQEKLEGNKSLIAFAINLAMKENQPQAEIIKCIKEMIGNNRTMMEEQIGHLLVCKVLNHKERK